MLIKPFRQKRRRCRGASLVEVAIIGTLLVAVALFSLDIGILVLGSSVNDKACRDAARAAAQASDSTNALKLAQASLKSHKTDGYFITQPAIDMTNFTYQDFAGNAPPDTSPFVEVTTSNTVRVPAPIFFFGAQFGGTNGTFTFRNTYNFPIVRTTLYLPP